MIFTPSLKSVCCQGDRLPPRLLLADLLSISSLELFIFLVLFPILSIFAVEFEVFGLDADRVRIVLALGYCSFLCNVGSLSSHSNVLFCRLGPRATPAAI